MSEFFLIDLYSQRYAVTRYVLGWSIEAVLEWVGHYGAINASQPAWAERPLSAFRSFVGLTCPFHFDDMLNLLVLTNGWFFS